MMKSKRLWATLLCVCMVLTLLPTVALAAPGDTETDPLICTTFAQFKAAMESTSASTRYIKLRISDENLPGTGVYGYAISQADRTNKTLILERNTTLTFETGSGIAALIRVGDGSTLNIKGSGTLKTRAQFNAAINSVVHVLGGVLNVHEGVTLNGGINTQVFGSAVSVFSGGTLNLYGGTLLNEVSPDFSNISVILVGGSSLMVSKVNIESGTVGSVVPNEYYVAGKAIAIDDATNPSNVSINIKSGFFRNTTAAEISGWLAPGSVATAAAEGGYSGVRVTAPTSNVVLNTVAPVAGATPGIVATTTANATISSTTWQNVTDNVIIASPTTFEAGKTYRCAVVVLPTSGYTFTATPTATINGNTPTYVIQNTAGIYCYYDFFIPVPPISSVALNVAVPSVGATPAKATTETANTTVTTTTWYHNGSTFTGTFAAGETYSCRIVVTPTSGNSFTSTPAATINGNAPTSYNVRNSTSITCSYRFTVGTNKPGDINGDGDVNARDLSILLENYGLQGAALINPDADLNNDGDVNARDLSILLENYGT